MVYLIHFESPLAHARHYIGFAIGTSGARRWARHRAGCGARLIRAVQAAGIGWKVVRTWPDGDRVFERSLKKRKGAAGLCPVCRGETTYKGCKDLSKAEEGGDDMRKDFAAEVERRLAAVRRKREEVAEAAGESPLDVSLSDDQLTEALGDLAGVKRRRPVPAEGLRPRCIEDVAATAATMGGPGDLLRNTEIARRIGVSHSAVDRAVKHLRKEGRWPYATHKTRKAATT